MIIGIDLGTSNSLVALWSGDAPVLVPNALGSVLTPSAVSIADDGSVLVGEAARDRAITHGDRTALAFKRAMGTKRSFVLGRREFRAEELSALVLRALKEDAEAFLGELVSEAVITVPAYFNDAQRQATKTAGELAGLRVERLLNEPTAAALAYGLLERTEEEAKFLIVDLGGGTFDVSIIEKFEGIVEVRATAGDNFLGGEDFANALVERFMRDVGAKAGLPPLTEPHPVHAQLRRSAELAKRRLSDEARAMIRVPFAEHEVMLTLTQDDFVEITEPLVARLRAPILRAMRDSRLTPRDITSVVLAGGATRMPEVRRMVARLFGQLPITHINPDEVVARGAAVQAALKMRDAAFSEVVLTDVAPFTLGIALTRKLEDGKHVFGLFSPIIERKDRKSVV
jgi:molecular chaperone HscC